MYYHSVQYSTSIHIRKGHEPYGKGNNKWCGDSSVYLPHASSSKTVHFRETPCWTSNPLVKMAKMVTEPLLASLRSYFQQCLLRGMTGACLNYTNTKFIKTTKKFFTFDVSTSIRGLHQKKLLLGLLLPVLGAIS